MLESAGKCGRAQKSTRNSLWQLAGCRFGHVSVLSSALRHFPACLLCRKVLGTAWSSPLVG
eukprot:8630284-Alexandrium_andersonii.AAC.1